MSEINPERITRKTTNPEIHHGTIYIYIYRHKRKALRSVLKQYICAYVDGKKILKSFLNQEMEKEKNDTIFDTKKETAEHASIKAPFKPFQTADQTCLVQFELQVKCRCFFKVPTVYVYVSVRVYVYVSPYVCFWISISIYIKVVVGKALECMYGIFGHHRRLK